MMITDAGVLYPMATTPDERANVLNFSSYNVHGANAVLMMADLFFSRVPIAPGQFIWTFIFPTVYCTYAHNACMSQQAQSLIVLFRPGFFQWTAYAFGNGWAYPFMDTAAPNAPGWYTSIIGLHFGFFILAYFLTKIRDTIADCMGTRTDYERSGRLLV